MSLVDKTEIKLLNAIEKLIKRPIERTTIEGWTTDMVKADVRPARERAPGTTPRHPGGGRRDSSSTSGNRSRPTRNANGRNGAAAPSAAGNGHPGRDRNTARAGNTEPARNREPRRPQGTPQRASLLTK